MMDPRGDQSEVCPSYYVYVTLSCVYRRHAHSLSHTSLSRVGQVSGIV